MPSIVWSRDRAVVIFDAQRRLGELLDLLKGAGPTWIVLTVPAPENDGFRRYVFSVEELRLVVSRSPQKAKRTAMEALALHEWAQSLQVAASATSAERFAPRTSRYPSQGRVFALTANGSAQIGELVDATRGQGTDRRGGGRPSDGAESAAAEIRDPISDPTVSSDETPINTMIRRTPHMDIPRRVLAPPEEFTVAVYADTAAARPGEDSEDLVIRRLPGQDEYPVVVWLVTTDHFTIVDDPLRTMVVKQSEPATRPVEFRLKVNAELSAAPAEITALFTYERRASGRVSRIVELARPAQAGVGSVVDAASVLASRRRPPALTLDTAAKPPDLTVDIADPDNTLRRFKVVVSTPLLDAYKKGVAGDWNLNEVTSEIVRSYFAEFTEAAGKDARLAGLKGAGRRLFEAAPDVFKSVFWELIDAGAPLRTISIVSQEPFIPWELMIPGRSEGGMKKSRPLSLGAEFAVARWPRGDHALPAQPLKLVDSCIFAPVYLGPRPKPLAHAAAEAALVAGVFPGKSVLPARFAGFQAAMRAGGADVLHFTCHGVDAAGRSQQVFCDDNSRLSSVQLDGLDELAAACAAHKPLVFLNACEVGRSKPALVGVGGFAQTFVEAGASCVIAPLWSIKDSVAHDFAKRFYGAILSSGSNSPLAEILASIRAIAYDEVNGGEDTYAAYCFYGDPNVMIATT